MSHLVLTNCWATQHSKLIFSMTLSQTKESYKFQHFIFFKRNKLLLWEMQKESQESLGWFSKRLEQDNFSIYSHLQFHVSLPALSRRILAFYKAKLMSKKYTFSDSSLLWFFELELVFMILTVFFNFEVVSFLFCVHHWLQCDFKIIYVQPVLL